MIFFKKTLPILLAVFFISVLVRVPQLNRPLSKHHEFCTAVSLRIMQIWYDNGIEKYNFNPVMTYDNAADKLINNSANASGKMVDAEGNYYYVSHPPFAYYFPFVVFKILHIRPDILPLQILNLLFDFLTALFVYFIVCLLSFNRARSYLHMPSFVAYSVYLFMPATLWFQGNVYMSDMAVQLPFVIGVYIVLKMIIRQKFYVPKYIFFYAANLFLMIYTSWLGVFFVFGVVVYSLLHVRANKGFSILLWSTVTVAFFVLQLIAFQYSDINGSEAYASELLNRYLIRGSIGARHQGYFTFLLSYLKYVKNLLYNYLVNYNLFFLLGFYFILFAASKSKLKIVFSENGYRFIWLSVLPIVLLHFVFLNYSSHDFTTLYASLFFSVLFGIMYDKMRKSNTVSIKKINALVITMLVIMVAQYTILNMPGTTSIFGSAYNTEKSMGEEIHKEAKKDEVVFAVFEPTPQLVFYAGRNILQVKNEAEAKAFLVKRNLTKGVYFDYRESNKFNEIKMKQIQLP